MPRTGAPYRSSSASMVNEPSVERRAPRRGLVCLAGLVAPLLMACAPQRLGSDIRHFQCDGAKSFAVAIEGDRAHVGVGTRVYTLKRREASVGIRFGATDVTFAQDGEDGFLVGAASGPYRRCRLTVEPLDAPSNLPLYPAQASTGPA